MEINILKKLIHETLHKEIIQLTFYETIKYYRVSILMFIAALFCLTDGFQDIYLANIDIKDLLFRFAIVFLTLSLIGFLSKKNSLKLKKLKFKTTDPSSILLKLAVEKNWEVLLNEKNGVILKTQRILYKNNAILNRSEGELIYVVVKSGSVFFRSIYDLSYNLGFVIPNGENRENENYVVATFKFSNIPVTRM